MTTNDHKRPVSHPWIPSFPSTSSGPAPTQLLCRPHCVGTSISPAALVNGRTLQTLIKLPDTSHHLRILSQILSTFRDNHLFSILFLPLSTIDVSHRLNTLKHPRLSLHRGLHIHPIVLTSKRMGGTLSSKISIYHSSTFPTDTFPFKISITCF